MVSYPWKEHYDMEDFRQIIAILRHPGGCPWDMVQDHHSIRRNFIEEVYEACEGIDTENTELLKEELGDVMMQVLFHASIEEDAGRFDINDVADYAVKKLIFRHPHVFGTRVVSGTEEVLVNSLCGGRRRCRKRPPRPALTGRMSPGPSPKSRKRRENCVRPPQPVPT